MIKNNRLKIIISSVITLLPMLFGGIFWNSLPEKVATHWNINGEADGWGSKSFAVFGLPLIMLALHLFCIIFTAVDPKNKNQNKKVFGIVLWICPVMSLFASGAVFATAFGKKFDIETLTLLLIGLMFVVLGNYLPKCKQNYTIGIKVMWALENEENWNATHRISGKLWVVGGLIMMACVFLPKGVLPWVLLVLMTFLAVFPVVYSYMYHKKQEKGLK